MNLEEPAVEAILKPLVSACSSGDIGTVESILAKWDSSSKTVPEYKLRRALQIATRHNQLKVVTLLLERGFQIESKVIQNAVWARSRPALETFLRHGWNINDRWRPYMLPGIW